MDLKRIDVVIEREPYGLVLYARVFNGSKEWTVKQVFYPNCLYSDFDRIFAYVKYNLKAMLEKEAPLDDTAQHN